MHLLQLVAPQPCINRIRLEFKAERNLSGITKHQSINRIRLEFKDDTFKISPAINSSINRIRLEFKANRVTWRTDNRDNVLIESDWNLKYFNSYAVKEPARINRIRLEFKANCSWCKTFVILVLIESDWNLKKGSKAFATQYALWY